MPLLDHFRPPLSTERHWESFHAAWSSAIADALNEQLPEGYFAEQRFQPTTAAITYCTEGEAAPPTTSRFRLPLQLMTSLEVHIYSQLFGPQLHSAIMFLSPLNKGVVAQRRAFVSKAFALLSQNISVAVIDTVTTETGNVHADLMSLLGADRSCSAHPSGLYASAYNSRWPMSDSLEVVIEPLLVGGKLPTLPVRISEMASPEFASVDLDETYSLACSKRRLN